MLLFDAGGIVGLALLAFWLYCLFDVIGTDESVCRNLPKTMWLLLVLFLPDIGGIAWMVMGRPQNTTWQPGSSAYRPAPRGLDAAPPAGRLPSDESLSDIVREREDLARMRVREEQLRRREEELRQREEELRRRDEAE